MIFYAKNVLISNTNNSFLIKNENEKKYLIIKKTILENQNININELKDSYIITTNNFDFFKHYLIAKKILEIRKSSDINQEQIYLQDLINYMYEDKSNNANDDKTDNLNDKTLNKDELLLFENYFFDSINKFGFTKISNFLNMKNPEIKHIYLEKFGTLEKNKSFFYFNDKKIYGLKNVEKEWINYYKIDSTIFERKNIFYDSVCFLGFKKISYYTNLNIDCIEEKFYEFFKLKNKNIARKNEILNSMKEIYEEKIFSKEIIYNIFNLLNKRKSILEMEIDILSSKFKISINNIRTFLIKNNFLIIEKKHQNIMINIIKIYGNSINIFNDDIEIFAKNYFLSSKKLKLILKKYKYNLSNKNKVDKNKNKSELDINIKKLLFEGYKKINKNYLISKDAKIFKITNNIIREVPWSSRLNNKGMSYYSVSIDAKQKHVHKLFAENFIENKNNYKYVSAKDGNFKNINFENIFWVESPSNRRVIKNIFNIFDNESKKNQSVLEFIINNFVDGMKFGILIKYLTKIAIRNNTFQNNENISLWFTIKHYSNLNKNNRFNIFIIKKENENRVYLDNEKVNKILKMVKKND